MHLGFIGAGLMSRPMIKNLLEDGHTVTVWNRDRSRLEPLIEHGAQAASSPATTAEAGGIVMSCLADDDAMDAVFADGQVARALGPGGVHVAKATISAACASRLAAQHRTHGVHYVAAPVLGRPEAVAVRAQSYVIAGDADARQRVEPVLGRLGRRLFEFGDDPAAANVAKINFNFLIAAAVEAMGEAFAVVEKSGLDARQFFEMVVGSAFGCPLYEGYGRILVEHGWDEPAFRLALGLKDVGLAQGQAASVDAGMKLGDLLEQRFADAVAHGLGDKDWTAVALDIRREAGL